MNLVCIRECTMKGMIDSLNIRSSRRAMCFFCVSVHQKTFVKACSGSFQMGPQQQCLFSYCSRWQCVFQMRLTHTHKNPEILARQRRKRCECRRRSEKPYSFFSYKTTLWWRHRFQICGAQTSVNVKKWTHFWCGKIIKNARNTLAKFCWSNIHGSTLVHRHVVYKPSHKTSNCI